MYAIKSKHIILWYHNALDLVNKCTYYFVRLKIQLNRPAYNEQSQGVSLLKILVCALQLLFCHTFCLNCGGRCFNRAKSGKYIFSECACVVVLRHCCYYLQVNTYGAGLRERDVVCYIAIMFGGTYSIEARKKITTSTQSFGQKTVTR